MEKIRRDTLYAILYGTKFDRPTEYINRMMTNHKVITRIYITFTDESERLFDFQKLSCQWFVRKNVDSCYILRLLTFEATVPDECNI